MDETKETPQDNPTKETPSGDKGTTPDKEPETLEEQVKHIKEAAFAEVGRYRVATEKATKAAETARKAADAAEVRLNKFIKDQEEVELEAARDDSDALTKIRARQRERGAESKLEKLEQELDEEREKSKEAQEVSAKYTKEQNAREIATRLNVDFESLVKFTDGSAEAMEDLARILPKKGEETTLKPDSGKTIGGGKTYKSEEVLKTLDPSKMTPQEISDQVKELAKAQEEGRIK